ncbi:MAG: hypothetical protein SV375_19350 [Thermodesulfobacteriota bacterium]|nr:hypothetical protein [Thermodesulfobacteriota bacterium]
MKKYILSTLCSAFVIPGLGQIINQNLKKGMIILSVVFILLILGAIQLALIIEVLFQKPEIHGYDSGAILKGLEGEDLSVLWILLIIFFMVWIYSVLDAFWTGKKIESQENTI